MAKKGVKRLRENLTMKCLDAKKSRVPSSCLSCIYVEAHYLEQQPRNTPPGVGQQSPSSLSEAHDGFESHDFSLSVTSLLWPGGTTVSLAQHPK